MKIVHLADLHLGYKAYNRLNHMGLNQREADVFTAFRESLEMIEKINPDLILMAGDIFHKPRPSNNTIFFTIRLLQKFRESCSAPIVIIAGNHEFVKLEESGSVLNILESVIQGVKIFDKATTHVKIDYLDTNLLCIPHGGLESLDETSTKPDKACKYNIMMIHGTYESSKIKNVNEYGGQLIKESDLNIAEWDYVAFGHYHTFTELAPNAYYSGAIERTTTNIWQEANDKKGFIEFDLDSKSCKFHSLKSPRQVINLKRIDADGLTAEEINQIISSEMGKILGLENIILRMTIENPDSVALRGLDYKKIKKWKKKAVHLRLNIIKKEISAGILEDNNEIQRKKGVYEYLEEELEIYELSPELNKSKFKDLARSYMEAAK